LTSCEKESLLLGNSVCREDNIFPADLIRFWFYSALSLPFHSLFPQLGSWQFCISFMIFILSSVLFNPLYSIAMTEKLETSPAARNEAIYVLMVFVISWLIVQKCTD
jgi:hypothetical protein